MCFFSICAIFRTSCHPSPSPPPKKKTTKNSRGSGSRSSLLFLLLPRLHCPELECDYRAFGCFLKLVVPQNGWFIMETPIKMDDLGVSLFSETSISHQVDFFRMEFPTDGIRDVNWSCTNEKLVLSAVCTKSHQRVEQGTITGVTGVARICLDYMNSNIKITICMNIQQIINFCTINQPSSCHLFFVKGTI